jgi:acid stress-induced BolA-like protein IbaG/YrbA
MHPENIKQLIEAGLQNSKAIIEGEDGQHFTAVVISPEFSGKTRIQKQQLVYAALNKHIADGTLHAISVKTFTPEEWQQFKSSQNG